MPKFKFPLTVDDQQTISDATSNPFVPALLDLAVQGQNAMEGVLKLAEEAKPKDIESLKRFRRDAIELLRRVLNR